MGTIQHVYTQTVADGTATSVVRPSDWNSSHAFTLQEAVSIPGGNTSGTMALISSGTLYLAATQNLTLHQSNNTISISGPTLLDVTLGGNTAGVMAAITSGTITSAGGYGITLSQNGNGISINGPLEHYYENLPALFPGSATLATGGSTIQVMPFMLPFAVSASFVRVPVSMAHVSTTFSGTSANSTWSYNRSYSEAFAIYTNGTGASSMSLQSITSGSVLWVFQSQVGAGANGSRYTVTYNVTYPREGATSQYTTSFAVSSGTINFSSESMTLFTGPRFLDIPWTGSVSPGVYWIAFGRSSASASNAGNVAGGGANVGLSYVGISQSNLSWGYPGSATAGSIHLQPGLGIFTTNAAVSLTASMDLSQISIAASHPKMYFQMIRRA